MPIDIFCASYWFEINISANLKLTCWFVQLPKNGQDIIAEQI